MEGIRDIKSNVLLTGAAGDGAGDMSLGPVPWRAAWLVGTYNGAAFDAQQSCAGVFTGLAVAGAGASTVTVKIQDSLDGVTWADLAATKYGTGAAPAGIIVENGGVSERYFYFTFKNFRRYIRAVVAVAGVDAGWFEGVIALERGRENPITQGRAEI